MNYDEILSQIIKALNEDKTIPQPGRNAVISSARRLQLEIRGARSMTNLQPPAGRIDGDGGNINNSNTTGNVCICKPGMTDKACPIHGKAVS